MSHLKALFGKETLKVEVFLNQAFVSAFLVAKKVSTHKTCSRRVQLSLREIKVFAAFAEIKVPVNTRNLFKLLPAKKLTVKMFNHRSSIIREKWKYIDIERIPPKITKLIFFRGNLLFGRSARSTGKIATYHVAF